MSNIFIGLKKTCLGVLERGERDKNNETGLKEGRGIEMSIYSAFHIRDARLTGRCHSTPSMMMSFSTKMHGWIIRMM